MTDLKTNPIPPKKFSLKRILYIALISIVVIVTLLAVGVFLLLRHFARSVGNELVPGHVAHLNSTETEMIGRGLLEGKFTSSISKVMFVSHPVEVDGKTGDPGIIKAHGNVLQMPQYILPPDEGIQLLKEMIAQARPLNILLDNERREKEKTSGEPWYRMAEKYPDYSRWQQLLNCERKSHGLDGSLLIYLKNNKAGRIYLRKCGPVPDLYFWVGDDRPIPMAQPIVGSMAVPNLVNTALSQVKIPSAEALFPERSSAEVNKIAVKKMGQPYQEALDYLWRSRILVQQLGPIKDIRPGIGENRVDHFMDMSARFTFLVEGATRTETVRINRGDYGMWGELLLGKNEIQLESVSRRSPELAVDFINRSVKSALVIGKPKSIKPTAGTECGRFFAECSFDVEGEKSPGVILMHMNRQITGTLKTPGGSVELETLSEGQRWPPPLAEIEMQRELIAYAVSRSVPYSHSKQKNLSETAFGFWVTGSVQNVSQEVQSFFVDTRHYHQHWRGKSDLVKTGPWPYIRRDGIIRVDLKPGEVYEMKFPLILSETIKPQLMRGSIAHAPYMVALEFTPLYSRVNNGVVEEVKDLGTFTTPEFGVIVEK